MQADHFESASIFALAAAWQRRAQEEQRVTLHRTTQLPITVGAASKRDLRTQFAALCYRVNKDRPEVLLITSRDTGRWVVPKGWPMDGKTPAQAAAAEAWEEAGVEGRMLDYVLGLYSYNKVMPEADPLPVVVALFPLRVKHLAADFPEKDLRRRKWFALKKAAAKVDEPELRKIILAFNPARLKL